MPLRERPFYASLGVQEVLIVDPRERNVHWLVLQGSDYVETERSSLIDFGAADLLDGIDWP
jgi:Uma2 family endonuclease